MLVQERRKEPRFPLFAPGRIGFGGRKFRVTCLVQNISSSGAKLVLRPRTDLPSEFHLSICEEMIEDEMRMRSHRAPLDLEREYLVQVRWRKRDALGVEFKACASSRSGGRPVSDDYPDMT
jgi:PilZ domain-containing protein